MSTATQSSENQCSCNLLNKQKMNNCYRQLVELQNLASHDIEPFFNLPAKLVTLKTKDKNEIIIDF